jgi:hypothetical protein
MPSFDGREGDDHNAFAALALELQPLSLHLSDQLTALTAGFAAVGRVITRRFHADHGERRPYSNEIENDY